MKIFIYYFYPKLTYIRNLVQFVVFVFMIEYLINELFDYVNVRVGKIHRNSY
jgi:hypothetical protein